MTQSRESYTAADAVRDLIAIGDEQRGMRGGSDEYPQITEDDHQKADEILLRLIANPAVEAAFDRIGKWYA